MVRQLSLLTYSSFKQTVTTINGEQSLTVSWSPLGNNGRKTNKFVFILSVVCFWTLSSKIKHVFSARKAWHFQLKFLTSARQVQNSHPHPPPLRHRRQSNARGLPGGEMLKPQSDRRSIWTKDIVWEHKIIKEHEIRVARFPQLKRTSCAYLCSAWSKESKHFQQGAEYNCRKLIL